LAGERICSIGLTPLYGGHPLELDCQAGFDCVRAVNNREVIDNLAGARHPSEHRVIGGIADFRISGRRHGGRRPGKRDRREPLDAQLLDPIAFESVKRMTLAAKAYEPEIGFIEDRRTEGVNVSEGKL